MLTGEVKQILIREVQKLIAEFQERRNALTEEDVDEFFRVRRLEFWLVCCQMCSLVVIVISLIAYSFIDKSIDSFTDKSIDPSIDKTIDPSIDKTIDPSTIPHTRLSQQTHHRHASIAFNTLSTAAASRFFITYMSPSASKPAIYLSSLPRPYQQQRQRARDRDHLPLQRRVAFPQLAELGVLLRRVLQNHLQRLQRARSRVVDALQRHRLRQQLRLLLRRLLHRLVSTSHIALAPTPPQGEVRAPRATAPAAACARSTSQRRQRHTSSASFSRRCRSISRCRCAAASSSFVACIAFPRSMRSFSCCRILSRSATSFSWRLCSIRRRIASWRSSNDFCGCGSTRWHSLPSQTTPGGCSGSLLSGRPEMYVTSSPMSRDLHSRRVWQSSRRSDHTRSTLAGEKPIVRRLSRATASSLRVTKRNEPRRGVGGNHLLIRIGPHSIDRLRHLLGETGSLDLHVLEVAQTHLADVLRTALDISA